MRKIIKRLLSLACLLACSFALYSNVSACPYNGAEFQLKQPDNTYVPVKVYGDEFYQRVESLDGYTLIRDPKNDWICYAKLNNDDSEFVSTGIVYKSNSAKTKSLNISSYDLVNLSKGLKLKQESVKKKVEETQKELKWDNFLNNDQKNNLRQPATQNSAKAVDITKGDVSGNIKGLTLLIDFPDQPSSISKDQINDFYNKVGYTDFSNNGSIRDYFYDVSGGKVTYTNIVTEFYTAKYPKSYYDNGTDPYGSKARELINEALQYFTSNGTDLSSLTLDSSGNVKCLNVMYAGSPSCGWSKGLWPHASCLGETINGISFNRYQMSNIGDTNLSIGTIVHENGHMLCNWPDTYDYGYESNGTGSYDIMSSICSTNPALPDPYCKNVLAGWGNIVTLNDYTPGTTLSVPANSVNSYIYQTSNPNEFFMIENMKASGRRLSLPDEGLAIWHIDRLGSNNYEQMTPSYHYQVSLEQADGLFDLEHNNNSGNVGDLYHADYVNKFGPAGVPNSSSWSGAATNFSIQDISNIGDTMTFTIAATQAPTIPSKVEAESFNSMSGIQTETCSEGGLDVSDIDSGDYLEYKVNVPVAGNYKVQLRTATNIDNSVFKLMDGSSIFMWTNVPNTNGSQTWTTVEGSMYLSQGEHTIRIEGISGKFSLNWINLISQ